MHTPRLLCLLPLALLATPAVTHAFEFRARLAQRFGTTDVLLVNNTVDASDFGPHRIRIQFGVFDNASGPAPAGGFLGWSAGTIDVGGPENNSDESRTPGRVNSNGPPGGNGQPPTDPFTSLTQIEAGLINQSIAWQCDAAGQPLPMPAPVIRGLNSFVNFYEITIDPRPGAVNYDITFAGNLIGATDWHVFGTPVPPNCPTPGSVEYEPTRTAPQPFSLTLHVSIPAPPAAALLGAFLLAAGRRRR